MIVFKIRICILRQFLYEKSFFLLLAFLIYLPGFYAVGSSTVNCGGNYQVFLKEMGNKAIHRGIDKNAVLLALKYSKYSKKVLEMDRRQSTFRLGFLDFSKRAINSYRLKNGRKNIEKY